MGIDKATLNRTRISGCQARDETGDYAGGTSIPQLVAVAATHGVAVEQHVGANVCAPYYAAVQLQAGRGVSLAGNCLAIGKGNVNHNIYINETSGGTIGHPNTALVYDPWSTGPSWWPWSKVLAFAAALRPWGEGDARVLGPGKFYAGIFPDTEPHVHLAFGGARTSPFPRVMTAIAPAGRRVNVRLGPGTNHPIATGHLGHLDTLGTGDHFTAFQQAHAQTLSGSDLWYGDHNGNRWVHSSGLH
jgi:hypothetical protein